MNASSFSFRLIACCVTLLLAGCSHNQVPTALATGRVLFEDGTPVKLGIVEALSLEHGTTATGRIQEDGRFVLGTYTLQDGAALGKHKVIVMQMIVAQGLQTHVKDHGRAVETVYGSYESSPLEMTIESGENEILLIVRSVK